MMEGGDQAVVKSSLRCGFAVSTFFTLHTLGRVSLDGPGVGSLMALVGGNQGHLGAPTHSAPKRELGADLAGALVHAE